MNLNLNADFLLDIWADLKAKKLAPVAVGLVVAAVAMPAVMLKGGEAAVQGPIPIAAPAAADQARVEVAEDLAEGSKLDSYKARDPFAGGPKPQEEKESSSGTAVTPTDPAAGNGLGGSSSGGSSGSSGSTVTPGLGGSGPGSDPHLRAPGTPPPPLIVKRPGKHYTYELDVRFGRPGDEKRYRNLSRMSFLPNPKLPALLFMGVPVDAKSALFFVYPGLSHQGEGECMPSADQCNFLKLAIGKEHYLSANDYEFHIKLLDVNRVKLSDARKRGEGVRKVSGARRSLRGEGEAAAPGEESGETVDEDEYLWLVDGIG